MVRFALCDVDGLYLTNPGDELTIDEPNGFRDLILNLERDEEYRGVTAEYGDGDTELGFSWNIYSGIHGTELYSPHTMLQFILENAGADGKVFLRYYTVQGSVETLDYEWALVFKAVEEVDDKIFFRVRKEDFGDKLRTRFETDINVAGTKDLDDNTVSAVPLITLPLHSRAVLLQVDSTIEETIIQSTVTLALTSIYTIFPFNIISRQEFPFRTSPPEFSASTPIGNEDYVFGPFPEKGTVIIDFSGLDITVYGEVQVSGGTSIFNGYQLDIIADVYDSFGQLVETQTLYDNDTSFGTPEDTSFTRSLTDLTGTATFEVERDYVIYFYVRYLIDADADGTVLSDIARLTPTAGTLEVDYTSFSKPSTIEGNFIFEILNDSLKKAVGGYKGQLITATVGAVSGGPFLEGEIILATSGEGYGTIISIDGSTYIIEVETPFTLATIEGQTSGATGGILGITYPNLLDSALLAKLENVAVTDGAASLNFVTTGKRIRQLPDSPLNVSNAKLIDFVRCRYNAGFIITEDSDGAKKVVVQRAADFFNEVEITSLENVELPTKRKLNNDLLYNEFEAGYEQYAKENENNSIEGFNTKRNWLLPLEKEKKKLSLIAPVITDGAEIERVRRLEINQDESDQADDQIFIIKCTRVSSTSPVSSANFDTARNYIDIDDADNKIYLKGFYLEGQLDTATEITLAVTLFSTTTQTITIDSVTYDAENNQTIINTTEAITAADGNYTLYSFYFNVDVFLPERLESFSPSFTTGIVDKYSEYNLDHAPSNFLFEWFNFIGGPLEAVAATKVVKFTQGVNNNDVSRRYATGAGFFTTSQILESADWLMSSLRSYNPAIFTKYEHEIVCYLTHAEFLQVRKSLLGLLSDASNYGYVSFTDNFGNLVQIWPTLIRRNPTTDRTEIIGWQKATVETGTFYILQETGDKIYREDSSGFLLRESASETPSGGIIETEDGGGFLTEDGGFFEMEG